MKYWLVVVSMLASALAMAQPVPDRIDRLRAHLAQDSYRPLCQAMGQAASALAHEVAFEGIPNPSRVEDVSDAIRDRLFRLKPSAADAAEEARFAVMVHMLNNPGMMRPLIELYAKNTDPRLSAYTRFAPECDITYSELYRRDIAAFIVTVYQHFLTGEKQLPVRLQKP